MLKLKNSSVDYSEEAIYSLVFLIFMEIFIGLGDLGAVEFGSSLPGVGEEDYLLKGVYARVDGTSRLNFMTKES